MSTNITDPPYREFQPIHTIHLDRVPDWLGEPDYFYRNRATFISFLIPLLKVFTALPSFWSTINPGRENTFMALHSNILNKAYLLLKHQHILSFRLFHWKTFCGSILSRECQLIKQQTNPAVGQKLAEDRNFQQSKTFRREVLSRPKHSEDKNFEQTKTFSRPKLSRPPADRATNRLSCKQPPRPGLGHWPLLPEGSQVPKSKWVGEHDQQEGCHMFPRKYF